MRRASARADRRATARHRSSRTFERPPASSGRFELFDPARTDVVVGSKRGYCFNDDACNEGKTPAYTSCNFQGLSVGCTDDYEPFLDCQYLDVTGVPDVIEAQLSLMAQAR